MARTTIDDCKTHCRNHFSLAYHVARRAQDILRRGDEQVPSNGDKTVVIALREVAKGLAPVQPLDAEAPPAEGK